MVFIRPSGASGGVLCCPTSGVNNGVGMSCFSDRWTDEASTGIEVTMGIEAVRSHNGGVLCNLYCHLSGYMRHCTGDSCDNGIIAHDETGSDNSMSANTDVSNHAL